MTYAGVETTCSSGSVAVSTAKGIATAILGEGGLIGCTTASSATAASSLGGGDRGDGSLGGRNRVDCVGSGKALGIVGVADYAGVARDTSRAASEAFTSTLSICCLSSLSRRAESGNGEKKSLEKHDESRNGSWLFASLMV